MEDILKHWWLLLVGGLLFLVLGFVSLAYPMTALLSVALYIGLIALATGIMSLAFAFSNMSAGGWGWRLFEGIVDVLFGLVMLIHPMISAALIPVIIGIWVFIRGLMYLIDALSWRRNRSRDWSGYAVIGVLLMVFGFLMIIDERFGLLPGRLPAGRDFPVRRLREPDRRLQYAPCEKGNGLTGRRPERSKGHWRSFTVHR